MGYEILHVISISAGKDSTATAKLAINSVPRDRLRFIFCDTGNEHEAVHDYLLYLERKLGITIDRLTADFSAEIAAKRMFIARDQRNRRVYQTVPVFESDGVTPVLKRDGRGNVVMRKVKRSGGVVLEPTQKERKVGGGRRQRWTNKAKRRALSVLHPTGNAFLDLCLWKGRFPSRKGQFCTEELKRNIAVAYQLELIDAGHQVISWQGVRRDESPNRRNAKKIERLNPKLWAFRPIVEWTATDVFKYCEDHGINPNPLYLQGMSRVGCMPCVNVNKAELRQIAARFPDHIARIAEWERLVSMASKRQAATFIAAPGIKPKEAGRHGIYSVVKWSKTVRGGKHHDPLADGIDTSACASSYGLCDAGSLAA